MIATLRWNRRTRVYGVHKLLSPKISSSRHQRRSLTANSMAPDIVIVGGGPTGLMMSLLLASYDVPSMVLEQQSAATRFLHPQAHFINTRTLEILQIWLPAVYERVREAMPPVSHWQDFCFGHSISDAPLVRVRHPVQQPLQANVDLNGVVVRRTDSGAENEHMTATMRADLSPCTVGHLAQHSFGQILYEAAQQEPLIDVRFGARVTNWKVVDDDASSSSSPCVELHTTLPEMSLVRARLCVAADGAHSRVRDWCGLGWQGQRGLQHLMNVHVQVAPEQVLRLHQHGHAMLYSFFHEKAIGMVVCHGKGDYILQIPFFPPYQDASNFGPDVLHDVVAAALGPAVTKFNIRSAKPWSMDHLLADSYVDAAGTTVLVGDAGHVFPPAGGLGMNTGLQDAHNLAWKVVAAVLHNWRDLPAVLRSYERERRPVAAANGALSMRNYQRQLHVTKACYLSETQPMLLKKMLDVSPLPLAARRATFAAVKDTALRPLAWLATGNNHIASAFARHIRGNLEAVLCKGRGLPLLFPSHELFFTYDQDATSSTEAASDTMAGTPAIQVGQRFPHAMVQRGTDDVFSTIGLPKRLSSASKPEFVLLATTNWNTDTLPVLAQAVQRCTGLQVAVAVVSKGPTEANSGKPWTVLCPMSSNAAFTFPAHSVVVLIRPDGHVDWMSDQIAKKDSDVQQQIAEVSESALKSMRLLID